MAASQPQVVAKGAVMAHGRLSPEECVRWLEFAAAQGFAPATVATAGGPKRLTGVRNNERVTFDDERLAQLLITRTAALLQALGVEAGSKVRLNPRFRVYRYRVGQRFHGHRDGVVELDGWRSRYSLLFYLDAPGAGGRTVFYDRDPDQRRREVAAVTPQPGLALMFEHAWWHAGEPIRAGQKHVLRTDVLFPGQ